MTAVLREVAWMGEDAMDDVRRSVSCYAGTGCGTCDACTFRARAFALAGQVDGPHPAAPLVGGDPQRSRP